MTWYLAGINNISIAIVPHGALHIERNPVKVTGDLIDVSQYLH
ncbi:MAG TPA: hypothetical protein VKZ75_12230 [Cyclobacteriaceae bacterium]|nr:hypothetical protein [Cyclobacteriaceae bacterium]